MPPEEVEGRGGRLAALESALGGVLARWPAVVAAWLFGSVATRTEGPMSDVDVAILGGAHLAFDERAQLTVELGQVAGRACDVVVAEEASPVLAMAVVDTGRRFLTRDAGAADAWEMRAQERYLGTAELRRIVYQYVREDLQGSR
jgi:predicted nucleotidyltransferase